MRFKTTRKFFIFLLVFLAAPVCCTFAGNNQNASAQEPTGAGSLDFANGLYARKMYGPAISEYDKFIRSNPNSPDMASARFRLADSFYFMKDYSAAASHFESFIKDFPDDKRVILATFRLGTAKFNLQEFKDSSVFFLQVSLAGEDPGLRSGALFYLAKTYEAMRNTASAVKIMKRLITSYPQTEYAAYAGLMLGDVHKRKKEFDLAIEAYKVAAGRQTPALVAQEASLKIADIYFDQKDPVSAEAYYRKVYAAQKNIQSTAFSYKNQVFYEKSLLGLLYSFYQTKHFDEAKKLFDAEQTYLEKSPAKFEALYLMANFAADVKQFDLAIEYFDRIENDPAADAESLQKTIFKKSAVLGLMGKKKEAVAELEKAKAGDPKNAAHAYFEQAEILREAGNADEAATAYEAVLRQPAGPYSKPSLYLVAASHALAGKKEKAREEFLSYVAEYPDDEDAQKALLQAIQMDIELENFAGALKNAKKFTQSYPKSKFSDIAAYKTGMTMTGLKKFKEASGFFRKIINENPKSQLIAESVYGAAVSLENAGETKEAVLFYEKFLKEYPDHLLANDATPRLGFLYVQAGFYDKAAGFYRDLLLGKPDIQVQPKTAFWLIRYFLDHSRYEEMQNVLHVLPQRFPDEDFAHEVDFFMAESRMGSKDYAKASEFYQKAIAARADGEFSPHAYLGLGLVSVAQGDLAAAEKNFSEALKYDSEVDVTLRARFEIASLKLRTGRLLEAANAFMLVAVLYDDAKYCPTALFKAYECFAQLEKTEDAEKAVQELKIRYPESEWAKKIG